MTVASQGLIVVIVEVVATIPRNSSEAFGSPRTCRSQAEIVWLLLLFTRWNDAEIVVVVSNDDGEEAVDAGMRPE